MEELFEAGVGEEDPFDDYRNILYTRHIEKLTDEEKLKGNKTILNIVNHWPISRLITQVWRVYKDVYITNTQQLTNLTCAVQFIISIYVRLSLSNQSCCNTYIKYIFMLNSLYIRAFVKADMLPKAMSSKLNLFISTFYFHVSIFVFSQFLFSIFRSFVPPLLCIQHGGSPRYFRLCWRWTCKTFQSHAIRNVKLALTWIQVVIGNSQVRHHIYQSCTSLVLYLSYNTSSRITHA